MIPLFGQEQPEGKRNVLEGRLVWLALSVPRIGFNVVPGFGGLARVECLPLRASAASVRATSARLYLQVDAEEQWLRVQARALSDAATSFADDQGRPQPLTANLSAPDETELETTDLDLPPAGFDSWEGAVGSLVANVPPRL